MQIVKEKLEIDETLKNVLKNPNKMYIEIFKTNLTFVIIFI